MGRAWNTHGREWDWKDELKERDHCKNLDVDGRIL
jgi:hypothetical protein